MDHHQTIREIFDGIAEDKLSSVDMSSLKLMLHYLDQEIENMDCTIIEVEKDEERCEVEDLGGFCKRKPGVDVDRNRIQGTFNILDGAAERYHQIAQEAKKRLAEEKKEHRSKEKKMGVVKQICAKVVDAEHLIHLLHKKTVEKRA